MIHLTRRYRFSASHRLDSPELSASENIAVYGKCNHPYGHGHDYVLEVRVGGPLTGASGRVVDVPALDSLVEKQVLSRLRHSNLGTEAGDIAGAVPTTENLASGIARKLRECWPEVFPGGLPQLESIRLHETSRNSIETSEPL
jgi:6-pyruvoyltetrahydropterin/6-carboxytetrahydropterin synthase